MPTRRCLVGIFIGEATHGTSAAARQRLVGRHLHEHTLKSNARQMAERPEMMQLRKQIV